jgi:hypothetical protein
MRRVLALIVLLVLATPAHADAVVASRAMLAETVAEYYVDEGGVRVELEIGLSGLPAFGNLLPDEIHEKLDLGDRPFAERLADFFAEDLPIVPDGGEPIVGRIVSMEPRTRTGRDEITGEALPPEEGAEKSVVHAVLEYPFSARPTRLGIAGPKRRSASIGFVVYHRGVAVNDFRYLGAEAFVLDLDWADPWYSAFRRRGLRRAYFAPMSGFLYVEPFEVRKEIIARPKDLQRWLDLGLEGRTTIPVEMQAELLRKVAAFLRERHAVTIDGEVVPSELARINFLRRTLRSSTVIDPPEELDLDSAMLGAIFVYPTEGLPKRVTMAWDLFDERVVRVPVAAVDPAGPMPGFVDPDDPVLVWTNFLKKPVMPEMRATEPPPGVLAVTAREARWPLVGVAALALSWLGLGIATRRKVSPVPLVATVLLAGAAGASFPVGERADFDGDRAREVVGGLLHNVYHAFQFREEERIYDVLDKTLEGDLLTEVYLDTRKSLELRSQGGARVRVKQVELGELTVEPAAGGGFEAITTWTVSGSVGHWGHNHTRTNRYVATLRIEARDGVWKLTRVDKESEERL